MMKSDPIRLRDDPAVSNELRDELRRAADSRWINYDVEAGLLRLKAALPAAGNGPTGSNAPDGGGAAPGPGPRSATGATSGLASSVGPALQGAVMGAIGGLAAVVLWTAVDAGRETAGASGPSAGIRERAESSEVVSVSGPANSQAPQSSPPADAGPEPESAGAVRMREPIVPPALQASDGEPVSPALSGREERAPPPPSEAAPSALPSDALMEELRFLKEIRSHAGNDPATALVLIEDSNRRFPGGLYRQERDAIAISALARQGRLPEARLRADVFLADHPRSPFADRVRRAVGMPVDGGGVQ